MTHGFDPDTQIWPTLAFPFAMPFTDHVTVVSDAFATLAAKDKRWPVGTVAAGGATLTVISLVMVIVADSATAPLVTPLAVAWIVTESVVGTLCGAV